MGFLSDVGRSQMFPVAQSIFRDVMAYKESERRDALTDVQMKRQMAEDQRRSIEFAQQQEQYKEMTRPRDIRGSVLYMMMPEEYREDFVKKMQQGGYADEKGMTTWQQKNLFLTELGKSKEGIEFMSAPFIMQAKTAADKAAQGYTNALSTGDPTKIETAKKLLEAALMRYDTMEKGAAASLKALGETDKEALAVKRSEQADTRIEQAERRLAETERYHKEQTEIDKARLRAQEKKDAEKASKDDSDKRIVKARTEARKEVDKAYGITSWLEQAKDPIIYEKATKARAKAEDIIDNYGDYGLTKEPTPGKAAEMAKTIVEDLYKAQKAAPAEDKKSKTIRELLFGKPSEKK